MSDKPNRIVISIYLKGHGSTALVDRRISKCFVDTYDPTQTYSSYEILTFPGYKVLVEYNYPSGSYPQLELCDFSKTQCIMICHPGPFDEAWIKDTRAMMQKISEQDVGFKRLVILVMTKCDIAQLKDKEDGSKLAKEFGVPWVETSAKTGEGVDMAFEMAVGAAFEAKKNWENGAAMKQEKEEKEKKKKEEKERRKERRKGKGKKWGRRKWGSKMCVIA